MVALIPVFSQKDEVMEEQEHKSYDLDTGLIDKPKWLLQGTGGESPGATSWLNIFN